MQTVKRSDVNPAPAKQQRPMGFSEFNHCVDVLLGSLPGIGPTAQSPTTARAAATKPAATPSPTSTCWEHNLYFLGQQAA